MTDSVFDWVLRLNDAQKNRIKARDILKKPTDQSIYWPYSIISRGPNL